MAGLAILLVTAALFVPAFGAAGAGMDEGTLVAYPTLVGNGAVPGRDFETFYGPGEPYLGAAAFEVFGPHFWVERAVGLIFRLFIVSAMFALLRHWGTPASIVGSGISLLVMMPLGVGAVPLFGALAATLVGLALATRRHALAAGLVAGLALAFRPDLALAGVLPVIVLLVGTGKLRRFGLGYALGAVPTVIWLAVVGPRGAHRLLSDLQASRPGRELPLPGAGTIEGQVLIAMVLVTAALLVLGLARLLSRRFDGSGRLCLTLGLFCLALFPAAVERADNAHILAIGCVVLGLLPAAIIELLRPGGRFAVSAKLAAAILGVTGAVAVLHAGGHGLKHQVLSPAASYEVVNGARSFPIESQPTARALNSLLPRLDSIATPGARVFVGPVNLRLTNYNDTFLYYLLPDLRPASFYMELNAGTANASHSGLANDLRRAQFLLLTTRYDDWKGPTATRRPGSPAPVSVVRTEFCVVAQIAPYSLLRRCSRQDRGIRTVSRAVVVQAGRGA
jgi:hypothetical protein